MTALARLQIVKADETAKPARARKAPGTVSRKKPGKKPNEAPEKTVSLVELIVATLDDAKAENVETIDLQGKSSIADHMVVATGRVDRHVGAIADQIITAMRKNGFAAPRIEGTQANEWVLIDAGDVIVHIFRPDARAFYNIERLWSADRPQDKPAVTPH